MNLFQQKIIATSLLSLSISPAFANETHSEKMKVHTQIEQNLAVMKQSLQNIISIEDSIKDGIMQMVTNELDISDSMPIAAVETTLDMSSNVE